MNEVNDNFTVSLLDAKKETEKPIMAIPANPEEKLITMIVETTDASGEKEYPRMAISFPAKVLNKDGRLEIVHEAIDGLSVGLKNLFMEWPDRMNTDHVSEKIINNKIN